MYIITNNNIIYWSLSKLGIIGDINWFMTRFHLQFIEKIFELRVAYFVKYIYNLMYLFLYSLNNNSETSIIFLFVI